MKDGSTPSDGTSEVRASLTLAEAWELFREGGAVQCPEDGGAVALAVDAAAGVYRFVCTGCGAPSPWFEQNPGGMRVRTPSPSMRPARDE
ncbi:MAG: hypothetical protein WCI05_02530 [Myxococcales bacterium]|jgi:hypothetical protein